MRIRTFLFQIQTVLLITVLLVSCSRWVRVRVVNFEPAGKMQEDYQWSRRGGEPLLQTPDFDLYWQYSGFMVPSGHLSVSLELTPRRPQTASFEVASATLTPLRVLKARGVEIDDTYPLEWRQEPHPSQDLDDAVTFEIYQGSLRARLPFRPKRALLTVDIENLATGEQETFNFILRT